MKELVFAFFKIDFGAVGGLFMLDLFDPGRLLKNLSPRSRSSPDPESGSSQMFCFFLHIDIGRSFIKIIESPDSE